jgi:ribonuclease D
MWDMLKNTKKMPTLFEHDLPDNLAIAGSVAIDTETMGLKPSRDRLCLVQLATADEQIYLVQFRNKFNAPNLCKVLQDPSVCKIFHYARFDMATLFHYLGAMPENIFCTKIASMLVRTYTDKHGLKNLVREILEVELDKKEQSSDWGADVLTDKQKDYAATDVKYLHKLWKILSTRLDRENRIELAKKCFAFLPVRVQLDLTFGDEFDIFAHIMGRRGD